MTINRNDLDSLDLTDVTSGEALPLSSPGEILRDEFLLPLDVTPYRLAKATSVPPGRITSIINNQRAISADTALRLGRFFGNSPQFWMNLQADYDLRLATLKLGEKLQHEVSPHAA